MPGVTLDAGALIGIDRGDRRVLVLLARARETGAAVTVPATVNVPPVCGKVPVALDDFSIPAPWMSLSIPTTMLLNCRL